MRFSLITFENGTQQWAPTEQIPFFMDLAKMDRETIRVKDHVVQFKAGCIRAPKPLPRSARLRLMETALNHGGSCLLDILEA